MAAAARAEESRNVLAPPVQGSSKKLLLRNPHRRNFKLPPHNQPTRFSLHNPPQSAFPFQLPIHSTKTNHQPLSSTRPTLLWSFTKEEIELRKSLVFLQNKRSIEFGKKKILLIFLGKSLLGILENPVPIELGVLGIPKGS